MSCILQKHRTFHSPSHFTGRLLGLLAIFATLSIAAVSQESYPVVGAERTALYLPLLQGKRVGLVGNQASVVYHENSDSLPATHLLDLLLKHHVQVVRLFSPEHGFRGEAEAGAAVSDGTDAATRLPIVSLYGNNRKPTAQQLQGLDVVVFDLQDMGVRFFTYISTLHYVMEACAQQGIPVIVMDRYNPHTGYIDGPVLDSSYRSFVGMHPVPVCYGMTIGEYALMINGEHWLKDSLTCQLTVIPMIGFTHESAYTPLVAPSPNLKTPRAMLLYPSLCLFEGTQVSVGRGTAWPFEVVGAPNYNHHHFFLQFFQHDFSFTPHPIPGASNSPLFNGQECYGLDLRHITPKSELDLDYLIQIYKGIDHPDTFFRSDGFFNLLAGNSNLRKQLESNATEEEIRASWQPALQHFKQIRKKYLLYPDFES